MAGSGRPRQRPTRAMAQRSAPAGGSIRTVPLPAPMQSHPTRQLHVYLYGCTPAHCFLPIRHRQPGPSPGGQYGAALTHRPGAVAAPRRAPMALASEGDFLKWIVTLTECGGAGTSGVWRAFPVCPCGLHSPPPPSPAPPYPLLKNRSPHSFQFRHPHRPLSLPLQRRSRFRGTKGSRPPPPPALVNRTVDISTVLQEKQHRTPQHGTSGVTLLQDRPTHPRLSPDLKFLRDAAFARGMYAGARPAETRCHVLVPGNVVPLAPA